MNLLKVYENVIGNHHDLSTKNQFGRRGKKFLKDSCKLANVSPLPKYPYFNPGGIAVMGDVYCNIQRPDGRVLEIIFGDMGTVYRTNTLKGSNYGPNIWITGPYNHSQMVLKSFDETAMAEIITKFITGRIA